MTDRPYTVLVTDGEHHSALAVVRSLGRAGHRVIVTSAVSRALAGSSRYAAALELVPNPLDDGPRYVDTITALAKALAVDVIVPVTDISNLRLLPHRRDLMPTRVAGPSIDAFRRVSDKSSLAEIAATVGLQCPRRIVVPEPGTTASPVSYPAVLKPSRSVGHRSGSPIRYAADSTALHAHLEAYAPTAYPIVIEERIVGPGMGVFLLVHEGVTIGRFAHRRLREHPPSGGASTLCESADLDATLFAKSEALLAAFKWEGVAMIEFKRDLNSDQLRLIEVNGRFWGSLQLAVDAGVDFPNLLIAATMGHPSPSTIPSYRVGRRLRSFWRDVDTLLARVRHSPQRLDMPRGSKGRLFALASLLLPSARSRSEVWRVDDPRPFVTETRNWFGRRLAKARR